MCRCKTCIGSCWAHTTARKHSALGICAAHRISRSPRDQKLEARAEGCKNRSPFIDNLAVGATLTPITVGWSTLSNLQKWTCGSDNCWFYVNWTSESHIRTGWWLVKGTSACGAGLDEQNRYNQFSHVNSKSLRFLCIFTGLGCCLVPLSCLTKVHGLFWFDRKPCSKSEDLGINYSSGFSFNWTKI